MGSFGPIHWIIVAIVVLLLFGGRGKLSGIMGDAAKGIKAFKEGLKDDTSTEVADNKSKGSLPRTESEAEELRKS
jgi:sec-independent protein translocase protein TatA